MKHNVVEENVLFRVKNVPDIKVVLTLEEAETEYQQFYDFIPFLLYRRCDFIPFLLNRHCDFIPFLLK